MLHIIGLIIVGLLKFLGIVLGLLLLIVLAILFVPIRYRVVGDADGDVESLKGQGYVSWLLHCIHVKFAYAEGKMTTQVRLFGIRVLPRKKGKKSKEKDKPPKSDKTQESKKSDKKEKSRIEAKKVEKKSLEVQLDSKEIKEVKKVKEVKEVKAVKEEVQKKNLQEPENVESLKQGVTTSQDTQVESTTEVTKSRQEKSDISEAEKRQEKSGTNENKKDDKKESKEKKEKKGPSPLDQVKAFYVELHKPENEGVLKFVWKYTKRLIKWIFPRRIDLNLEIGLEDHVITGYIAAVGSVGYGITKGHVVVVPRFDEEIMAGTLKVKSHLFLYQPLYYIIRLIIDKRVRRMIAFIRK